VDEIKLENAGKIIKNHSTFAIVVKKHSAQNTPIARGSQGFVKKS